MLLQPLVQFKGIVLLFNGSGGLAGFYESSGSVVRNSYALGPVAGSSSRVGGLVGNNQTGSIIHSYARGPVYSKSNNAGALTGTHEWFLKHSRTYMARAPSSQTAAQGAASLAKLAGLASPTAAAICMWTTLAQATAALASCQVPHPQLPAPRLRQSNGCGDPRPPP